MKKIFTIFILLYAVQLFSQKTKIEKSIFIGNSFNSVYLLRSFWEYKYSPLLFGVQLASKINSKIKFSTDFYYIRKGPKLVSNPSNGYQNYIFDYVIIAPHLKLQPIKSITTMLNFGPYYGISTISKAKFDASTKFRPYKIKRFDLGINASLSQYFTLSNRVFFIEPRFQLGLFTFSRTRHISWQLMLGMKL
jgi:hypothetical protein